MKKVLIMVGEENSANGICAKAVMQKLYEDGYSVSCICNKERGISPLNDDNKIKFYRIKPRLTYRLRSFGKEKQGLISKIALILSYLLNKAKLFLSFYSWPLISPLYSYRFYNTANKLIKSEKFDVIIPIYTQIDTVIAASILKRKHTDIKYVPYFLDALSGGYGPKIFSKSRIIKRGIFWEKALLKNADKIIAMESSKEHHMKYSSNEEYYKRFKFLDIPLLIQRKPTQGKSDLIDQSVINFVYTGSIPLHIRNPIFFLKVLSNIDDDMIKFSIIGPDSKSKLLTDFKENMGDKLVLLDKINHSEISNLTDNSDFLVNFGNNLSSMVPSKIFEYMSSGKPIISTFSCLDDPCINYLKNYPLSFLINENRNDFSCIANELMDFVKQTYNKEVDLLDIIGKYDKNTPTAFAREISNLF